MSNDLSRALERYRNDATFHAIVCSILRVLDGYKLSPESFQEAVDLAMLYYLDPNREADVSF